MTRMTKDDKDVCHDYGSLGTTRMTSDDQDDYG